MGPIGSWVGYSLELAPGITARTDFMVTSTIATTLVMDIMAHFRRAARRRSTTSMPTRRGMDGVTQAQPVMMPVMNMPFPDIEAVVVVMAAAMVGDTTEWD